MWTTVQICKCANIQIYEHNDARKEILVIYDHKVHLLVTNTATYLNSWMVSFIEFPIADSATWPLLKGCQALGRGSDREEICIDYETYFDLITKMYLLKGCQMLCWGAPRESKWPRRDFLTQFASLSSLPPIKDSLIFAMHLYLYALPLIFGGLFVATQLTSVQKWLTRVSLWRGGKSQQTFLNLFQYPNILNEEPGVLHGIELSCRVCDLQHIMSH